MSGSGGGGGSTGAISYPAYMQTFHGRLLDDEGAVSPLECVLESMNVALGNSPYVGVTAYDPDTALDDMEDKIDALSAVVVALAFDTDFATMQNAAIQEYDDHLAPSATYITNKIAAYSDDLTTVLNSKLLPSYRAGMRDIRAVMTSAFTLGEAILSAEVVRQAAKFSSDIYLLHEQLRIDSIGKAVAVMASMLQNKVEYTRIVAALTIEQRRMKIVAKVEEAGRNVDLDVADAKWDLELFQYPSNVLASIAGAAAAKFDPTKSSLSTGLGGALSGASAGMMLGGQTDVGAGWGGVIGAVLGYGAALL